MGGDPHKYPYGNNPHYHFEGNIDYFENLDC